jgi:hypothetical protein
MKSHVAKRSVIVAHHPISRLRLIKLLNSGDLPFEPDVGGLAAGDAGIMLLTTRGRSPGDQASYYRCSRRVSLGVGCDARNS